MARALAIFPPAVVCDAEGGFQAVQGNVQQQGADHATLGRSQRGGVDDPILHDPSHEPLPDQFATGSGADVPE